MHSTLHALLTHLDNLEAFVRSIEPVNTLLATHNDSIVRRYLTVRRRLDYAAFIVALYAAFEGFVEDLAWSHTQLESSSTKYSDLSEKLRTTHLRQSAELLARARLGEGRYAEIKDVDLVGNLHACLSGLEPYKLNRHAVIYHEMNLRLGVVQGLFTSIGIEDVNDAARRADPLLLWYREAKNVDAHRKDGVPAMLIELRLNDLVERRNQLTHNGGDPNESLGSAEMSDLLEFVKAYCRSLHAVLVEVYLDRAYVKKSDASAQLGVFCEGPFDSGHVVVVPKPTCRIYVEQPIFGWCDGRVHRWGTVKEIKLDDDSVQSVEVDSTAATIGLRVDFKVTKHTRLYVLHSRDNVIWC